MKISYDYEDLIEIIEKIYTHNDEFVKYLDSNGKYNLDHLDNVYSRVSVSDYKNLLEYGYYSFDDFNIIIESFDGSKHFNELCEIFQY